MPIAASAPPSPPPLVLVAEDDDEMRRLLTRALRRDGYDVAAASDGDGLARLMAEARRSGREPDLIVSDVRMPQLDGLQLVSGLRAAGSSVKVILVSAFADAATHEAAARLGVAHVLSKPFELDDLRTVAMNLLRRR
ncbi:MAG: response regulator [Myxococcota bacterium]|nr:response regulator [Myxococcota bacterium]